MLERVNFSAVISKPKIVSFPESNLAGKGGIFLSLFEHIFQAENAVAGEVGSK